MPDNCPICGDEIEPTPEEQVLGVFDKREHGDPEEIFGSKVSHVQDTMHRSCAEEHGLDIENYPPHYFDLTDTEQQIRSFTGGEPIEGIDVLDLNISAVEVDGGWRLQADNPFEQGETFTERSLQALLRTIAGVAEEQAEDRDVPEEFLKEPDQQLVDMEGEN